MKRIIIMFAAIALLTLSAAGTAFAWNPDTSQKCVDGVSVTTVTLHAEMRHSDYRLDGGEWVAYKDGDKIEVEGSATLDQRQRNNSEQEWDKITTQIVAIDCETPPPPTPTPTPVSPTFKIACEAITVSGVTDGWQFIVEPGDMLLPNGTTALKPGDYTYNERYNGQDGIGDSGKFTIVACPTPTPKPTGTPAVTPTPTEEPTVPATDTVGGGTSSGTGSFLPLLALLSLVSAGSLVLTAKRR
jgi:hypothetical protein